MSTTEREYLQEKLEELKRGSEGDLDQSESKLKSRFHKAEILEQLGYEEQDIKVEKSDEKGKRTDIHCNDDYGNVKVVIEFKRPEVSITENSHKSQIFDDYMKPLKADYGILYNGLRLIGYERVRESSKVLFNLDPDSLDGNTAQIADAIRKPDQGLTDIDEVVDYIEKFDTDGERLPLEDQQSREHFFENFKLEQGSAFEELLVRTLQLMESMEGEDTFLSSAYSFWKESYAKTPDEVPDSWKRLMEDLEMDPDDEENMFKYMFALETAYAVFARLIMAKSGDDYDFPRTSFSGFVERNVQSASNQGDIALASWAKITQDLISDMREKMVDSIFEEDIFYWWTEPFDDKTHVDFFKQRVEPEAARFGQSLGKIILMMYKFDFARIDGDPLGVLYQQYFDKETRKALGEFYTPQEVVDYILDSVDYEGRKLVETEKRLLDPACGSGTFPVTAVQRYIDAAERSGHAEENGWDTVLDEICNQYRIVGFDIHPFATLLAQIQFMLAIMKPYKKALESTERGEYFQIKRIPIFRTDSLKDESKGEDPSLDQFEEGTKFKMDIELPVNKQEGGKFFEQQFEMPTPEAAREAGLYNNQEYFLALQAFFDVIKDQARKMQTKSEIPQFQRERFERQLKRYGLENKEWNQVVSLFQTFADRLLQQIDQLQSEFDDGRLVKSIEDIYLAALLKNEQKYDYVVGNPPYVRQEAIGSEIKQYLKDAQPQVYHGRADLSIYFLNRGIEWLNKDGRLGFITSNKFMKTNYGEGIRELTGEETTVTEAVDFGDTEVFEDATAYASIICLQNSDRNNTARVEIVEKELEEADNPVKEVFESDDSDYTTAFGVEQEEFGESWKLVPKEVKNVLSKVEDNSDNKVEDIGKSLMGMRTGRNEAFVVDEKTVVREDIEREILRPVLKGSEVEKYYTGDSRNHIIYTPLMDPEKHKAAFEHLKKYEEKLKGRKQFQNRDDMEWWEIEQPESENRFEETDLISPDLSQKNRFSVGEVNFHYLNTCYGINLNDEFSKYKKAVLGVLNTDLMDAYIKTVSPFVQQRYYRYRKQYIDPVPLNLPEEEEEREELERLVDQIINRKKKTTKIGSFPEGFVGDIELELKSLKCNSGHPDMKPSIQTTQDGMFEVEVGKRKTDSILLSAKEKAKFYLVLKRKPNL
jgi:type I restriction-modification system DNA methylase subunit